jgi:hypothetical protein
MADNIKPSVNTNNKYISGTAEESATKPGEFLTDPNPKYDNVQTLNATQTDPSQLKTTNFKQDYVVIIRKKPFYAATAQQRTEEKTETTTETVDNEDGTTDTKEVTNTTTVPMTDSTGKVITPEENYIRVYQVNNFSNIRVTTSIYGKRPGSCNVTIRGGERVVCAEKKNSDSFGWQSWDELLNGWLSINENGRDGASEDSLSGMGIADQINAAQAGKYTAGVTERLQNIKKNYNLTDEQTSKLAAQSNGKKWTISESSWAISKSGGAAAGTDFRNLFKTREAKYGWRFAEKCDWQPMDEIWIFGKSRTARTGDSEPDNASRDINGILTALSSNGTSGEFKFLPIFFGYIDTVTKTFTANKGGCLITVAAQDHLKLLDLSRIVSSPTFIPGINPGGGVDIRFSKDKYGLYDLNQPLKDYKGTAQSDLQKKAELKDYMLQNIMAGKYPKEIIQILGSQAGIPDKYLTARVEDIMEIPFLWKVKEKPGDFFNGEMKSRLGICNEVAEKLFIEFFADEEGNIVLKIPNYCLGVNKLKSNNMGINYPDDLLQKVYGSYKIETINNIMTVTVAAPNTGAAGTDTVTVEPDNSGDEGDGSGTDEPSSDPGDSEESSDSDEKIGEDNSVGASSIRASSIDNFNNIKVTINEVGQGDHSSLYAVAEKYLGDGNKWKKIAYDNNIKDPSSVKPGDTILVTVKASTSDTLDNGYGSDEVKTKPTVKPNLWDKMQSGAKDILSSINTKANNANKTISTTSISSNGTKTINTSMTNANGDVTTRTTEVSKGITNADGSITTKTVETTRTAISNVKTTTVETEDITGNITTSTTTKETGYKTLSETTDMDIPAIEAAYVVSFTLIDTDKEIFNMYEVGGESLMGVFDANKGSAMTQIRRAIPDIDSIIQFGLRPHPGIVNTPLVGNPFEAEMLGMIMLLSSQANRYTGSVTVIDGSVH